jgi:hypothetical protein
MTVMSERSTTMDVLDFELPEFTRIAWVSDAAREVWEPRLTRITKAWQHVEWLSIVCGMRRCAVTMVSPTAFVAGAAEWARQGLCALPLAMEGVSGQSYTNRATGVDFGKPFVFRVVLGEPRDVARFKEAWDGADHAEIGRLLGYPSCCHEFFRAVWVDEGLTDTTWPMAVATAAGMGSGRTREVTGAPEANILWRWMGVRAVPHLPCRFDCPATVEVAKQLLDVARRAGYDVEVDWLLEILGWPTEWSALHGIAEIKTPVLKVTTQTDATAHKYVVRRLGHAIPPEAGSGLRFPYRVTSLGQGTRVPTNRRRGDSVRLSFEEAAWYASDNGFRSRTDMEEAHRPIIDIARRILAGQSGAVLDLGCGNGALVHTICANVPGLVPYGVEMDSVRVRHARLLAPAFGENIIEGNIFDAESVWATPIGYLLAILMPGRLLEVDRERARALRKHIDRHCQYLLVYAYPEWLARYGTLARLANEAGLELLDAPGATAAGLARVVI